MYANVSDVPKTIRDRLTPDALTTFKNALNMALIEGKNQLAAYTLAWNAVKDMNMGFDSGAQGTVNDQESIDTRLANIIGDIVTRLQKKYSSNAELPKAVRDALPDKAQSIFRNVVNSQLDRGLSDTRAFSSAWGALKNQGWSKDKEGKWKLMKSEFSITGKITKFQEDQNLVFGWASIIEDESGVVKDLQGDVIRPEELEKSAYAYVLDARLASEMHKKMGVGNLVESMVFTKQKIESLGLPEGSLPVGWWVGFKVDSDIFAKVKDGTYTAFSIGGSGKRKVIEE